MKPHVCNLAISFAEHSAQSAENCSMEKLFQSIFLFFPYKLIHISYNSVPGSGVAFVKFALSRFKEQAKLIVSLISLFVSVGKPIIKNPTASIPAFLISSTVFLTKFLFNFFFNQIQNSLIG